MMRNTITSRLSVASSMITTLAAAGALAAAAPAAQAQAQAPATPGTVAGAVEVRPFVGAFLPTGDLSDQLESAVLVGAQVGWHFHPNLAVTGSFAWAPTKDKTTAITGNDLFTGREEKVDLFQYDIGLEGRLPIATEAAWGVTPYATLGVGGRTYSYRDIDDVDSQTNFLGFGALGVDIAPKTGILGIRLEARDYVSAFKGLRGELDERKARNDVQLAGGLTFHF
ncbi:MAG TPA: outer membrane beta-barrel protein [Gemmatimonadaceae bacterium]